MTSLAPLPPLTPPASAALTMPQPVGRKNLTSAWFFLLVLGIHGGAIGLMLFSPATPIASTERLTVQGIIIPAVAQAPVQMPPPVADPVPVAPTVTPVKKPQPPKPKPVRSRAPAPEPLADPVSPAVETLAPTTAPTAVAPSSEAVAITPPQADADHLNNPRPAYPPLSRRLREEGTVILDVLILADGRVGDVRLKKSSGFKRLDDTAIRAVKRWRYQPARRGDETIDHWYPQPVEFSLH